MMLTCSIHSVYSQIMNVQYILLGLLDQQPNYGYELKKIYDLLFSDNKPILSGQIYSTLNRLMRDKKIEERLDKEESNGPERIKYAITTFGQQELEKWLITPEKPAAELQQTMYVKTVLAILRDGDAAEYLNNQRKQHINQMRVLTKQKQNAKLDDKLQIDYKLFHLEADLRWIELTSSRLTQLKEEICL